MQNLPTHGSPNHQLKRVSPVSCISKALLLSIFLNILYILAWNECCWIKTMEQRFLERLSNQAFGCDLIHSQGSMLADLYSVFNKLNKNHGNRIFGHITRVFGLKSDIRNCYIRLPGCTCLFRLPPEGMTQVLQSLRFSIGRASRLQKVRIYPRHCISQPQIHNSCEGLLLRPKFECSPQEPIQPLGKNLKPEDMHLGNKNPLYPRSAAKETSSFSRFLNTVLSVPLQNEQDRIDTARRVKMDFLTSVHFRTKPMRLTAEEINSVFS